MKKKLLLLTTFLIFNFYFQTQAQSETYPWQVEMGINAVDVYPTGQNPYGALFEDFFKVDAHWNISPFLSYIGISNYVGRGFSLGFRFGFNTLTKYGPEPADASYFNADAIIKYNINTLLKWNRVEPYLEFGGGYSIFGEKGDGSFNAGAGIAYMLGDKKRVGLNLGTTYKATGTSYGIKHFQHILGLQFRFGEVDTDDDGVIDEKDQCPDVPGLAAFDGCPDTDGDGIADREDQCPEEAGSMAHNGCPDRDQDGVIDREDNCPDIAGLRQHQGCPDRDGDGVIDSEDECPSTAGAQNLAGCPDRDGDGIKDEDDRCPDNAGTQANNGCPEMEQQQRETLNDFGQVLLFKFNSYSIIPDSIDALEGIYEILKGYPEAKVIVTGHTDSVGSAEFNMALSEMRAQTVVNYLIKRGLDPNQFTAIGKGETEPVASNNTEDGRKANRRVTFTIDQ